MKQNLGYRGWFYFRMGWATYFAFILAAINSLVVTYYLAIENLPILKEIFPTFLSYVVIAIIVGIPLLTFTGYVHYKKSGSYKAEADVHIESNPHMYRMLQNSEKLLQLNLEMFDLLSKLSPNDKISDSELEKISKLKQNLLDYMNDKTIDK
jgi:hypothetical protein